MKAVIIAAGQSSRLWEKTNHRPKTLLPYKKSTILSRIVRNLKKCGIEEIIIVVGWRKNDIIQYVTSQDNFGIRITFVENPEWRRGNGLSVLAAEREVGDEPFILSMCDHIVPPKAIKRLIRCKRRKNLLLVDKRIEKVFDLDDATKVLVKGKRILRIGKELEKYNGIDCGVFRLDGHFFRCMRAQAEKGLESISAGVTALIAEKRMGAVFIKKKKWIDIDTPEAYRHALKLAAKKKPLQAVTTN